jgi:hypothetical protein
LRIACAAEVAVSGELVSLVVEVPVLPHAAMTAASTIYNNVILMIIKKMWYVLIRCDADTTYRILDVVLRYGG